MRPFLFFSSLSIIAPITAQLLLQNQFNDKWGALRSTFDPNSVIAPPSCPSNPGPSCPLSTASADVTNSCCVNAPGAYFALTQFWDATPKPVGPVDSWTIHGLWPDYCSESPTDWPSNCDASRVYSKPGQLRDILKADTELVAYMDEFWKPDSGTNENFWEHEWNKHGTCVSTLFPACYTSYTPHEEVLQFFRTAVALFKTLPTHSFLATSGIVPSINATYSLAQLQESARKNFNGMEASWGCKKTLRGWELNQVFWGHVSVGQSRENAVFLPAAPGALAVNSCPATGILYYPKDGTAPSPAPSPPRSPRPPSRGKALINVSYGSGSSQVESGCLISTGKWLVGATCAGFAVSGDLKGEFEISTSKGPCQVSRLGTFTCANRLDPTTFTLDSDGNLKPPAGTFYANLIPRRGTQAIVGTGKSLNPVKLNNQQPGVLLNPQPPWNTLPPPIISADSFSLFSARELQSTTPYRSPSLTPPQIFTTPGDSATTVPLLLPVVQEESIHSSTLPTPPGINNQSRRPRAGTLPSTFHLNTLAATTAQLRHLNTTNHLLNSNGNTSASLPASGSTTPIDDLAPYSSTSNGNLSLPLQSRLRSGSLTLPGSGLSNAFGPSLFTNSASAWPHQSSSQPTSTSTPTIPPGGGQSSDSAMLSPDSSSMYGDSDSHVRTLDYLGLDGDSPVGGFGPFSDNATSSAYRVAATGGGIVSGVGVGVGVHRGRGISLSSAGLPIPRLGSMGNLAAMGELYGENGHGRMRSNTVATFPRSSGGGAELPVPNSMRGLSGNTYAGGGIAGRGRQEEEDYYATDGGGTSSSNPSSYHRSNDSVDSTRLLYSTTAQVISSDETDSYHSRSSSAGGPPVVLLQQPNGAEGKIARARAATIGNGMFGLEGERGEVFGRKRAGTTMGSIQQHSASGMGMGMGMGMGGGLGVGVGGEEYATQAGMGGMVRGLRGLSLSTPEEPGWNSSTAPLTPEIVHSHSITPPPPQQPTRSLWIGNLDPKTTTAELQAVFAPYGAIESLRLIPEKECGFINFVSISDALRAKEDVLNRLGGQLTKSNSLVRIGFGKADATPSGIPSMLGGAHRSPGLGGGIGMGGGGQEPNLQTAPTRALWIGSIPSSTTPGMLLSVFAPFGAVESARVLTHKSCGFINYERIEDAISARKALNGRDILGAEVGAVRIGFAKVPTKILGSPSPLDSTSPSPPIAVLPNGLALQDYRSNLVVELGGGAAAAHLMMMQQQSTGVGGGGMVGMEMGVGMGAEEEKIETVLASTGDLQLLMREISGDTPETEEHVRAVAEPRLSSTYYTSIPQHALTDPSLARRYGNADAPRLRELRKRLDSPHISTEEVDEIAYELVEESVALASDYIGNTLIQKIFERASLQVRLTLLDRIAPHLATIGTHKNGTWAVQKIIQCVQTAEEFMIVEQNLQPYTPPLLLNDFGNYVVQGALRFGTDFVFDAMVDRCWEIGSGRFGARSTRQTLESPLASKLNIKRVAIAIVLNSIPLATSSNGALLVTWLLDSSNLAGRYRLLAPRFSPHLVHLCTHKLASIAVLKVINQRVDMNASRIILDAIFDPQSKTLEDILGDQSHGVACITKLLSSSFIDPQKRPRIMERVRDALLLLRVQAVPAYRKLCEDVGIPFVGPAASPHYPQQAGQYQQPGMSSPQQQQWAPGAPSSNFSPYNQYDYAMAMGYASFPSPYQQGGAYPYFVPPHLYSPQNNFMGSTPSRGQPSPMMSPLGGGSSTAGGFSPPSMPAGLPGITSPDPFTAFRVLNTDHGFNPAFNASTNPYFGNRSYEANASALRPEAVDYYTSQSSGNY